MKSAKCAHKPSHVSNMQWNNVCWMQ